MSPSNAPGTHISKPLQASTDRTNRWPQSAGWAVTIGYKSQFTGWGLRRSTT
jgi:hypothetical protein